MIQSLESRRVLQEVPSHEPLLILTTQDRDTGRPESELLIYRRDECGHFAVLATNTHNRKPNWYLNLKEEPVVQLEVDGANFYAMAVTPTGTSRLRLRELFESSFLYPGDTIPRDTSIVLLRPMC
jgi:hypothetical protein